MEGQPAGTGFILVVQSVELFFGQLFVPQQDSPESHWLFEFASTPGQAQVLPVKAQEVTSDALSIPTSWQVVGQTVQPEPAAQVPPHPSLAPQSFPLQLGVQLSETGVLSQA